MASAAPWCIAEWRWHGSVHASARKYPRQHAADPAESLDALAYPGASAPVTGATTLTVPKPVGGKGFFKVWVSDTRRSSSFCTGKGCVFLV